MKNLWQRTLFRTPGLIRFLPVYLREMTISNLRVARDALRKNPRFTPGFAEISLKGYDPVQQWEAACLISMTPGTLSVDLDEDTDLLRVITRITHFYHHESCGQCTPCREGCGWMEKILRRFLDGEGTIDDIDLLLDVANNIEGNTICALGDAAAWPVQSVIKKFRNEFEKRIKKTPRVKKYVPPPHLVKLEV